MNMHVKAGQGDIGQRQFADNNLYSTFTGKAQETERTQRETFVKLAYAVRHCSDNFVPSEFERRHNGEEQPIECLEKLMQANVKGLKRLSDHMDVIRSGLPDCLARAYDHRIESECARLDQAQEFFSKWKQENRVASHLILVRA